MPTGSVIVIDCCLFFGCKTGFAQNDTLDLWNAIALPLIQMIVFLCCCSWYFSTFNYISCPFLCSSFFLTVWISLSITYRQTFELTCAPSFSDLHILRYWWPPAHPSRCKRNNWMLHLLFLCSVSKKVNQVDFFHADKH